MCYFTKRTAEDWLRSILDEAPRGVLPGMVRTGATVSDAAAEWLRYSEEDRAVKATTTAPIRPQLRGCPLDALVTSKTPVRLAVGLSPMH